VLFPTGTTRLVAIFDYKNMPSGIEWTRTWSVDGETALTKTEKWQEDRDGRYPLELTNPKGLQAGAWRLELLIAGKLAAVEDFQVTGSRGRGTSFAPIVFAKGIDKRDQPVGAAKSFSSGLKELYAFSDYSGMADGLNFTANWYVNGQKVVEAPYEWNGGESGTWNDYLFSDSGALPDGEYSLELVVEGQVLPAILNMTHYCLVCVVTSL
jgi:hypothetical protein